MNPYVLLGVAIVAELVGTTALNLSDGFTRVVPSIGVLVGYAVSFYRIEALSCDIDPALGWIRAIATLHFPPNSIDSPVRSRHFPL
ncbi:SMR family transporter [Halobium palmae]|uniref:SMR family transporter n=1 Tax=Halobium palmae TaxID=1776492 RepID=A0ABD5RWD5_9EURY